MKWIILTTILLLMSGVYASNTTLNNIYFNTSTLIMNKAIMTGPSYYMFGTGIDTYSVNITLENGTVLNIRHVKEIRMIKEDKTDMRQDDLNKIYSYLYKTALHTQNSLCKGDQVMIQTQCDCAKNTNTPCMVYCYKCLENQR